MFTGALYRSADYENGGTYDVSIDRLLLLNIQQTVFQLFSQMSSNLTIYVIKIDMRQGWTNWGQQILTATYGFLVVLKYLVFILGHLKAYC
jgi:hypothetical protein